MGENTIGDKAVGEIRQLIREDVRRMRNQESHRGRWQFHGGSGGGHIIWFEIAQVLCPGTDYVEENTLVVNATWYTGGCSKVPPGSNDDGTYDVYDLCSYLSGMVAEDLVGTIGRATYHYPLSGACEPRWILDDLCHTPECA